MQPRHSASLPSVLSATRFQWGSNRRQGAETSYKPLDSFEQGETQQSGGQAEIQESSGQDELQENAGQAVTQGSDEEFGVTSRSYIRLRHTALMNQFNSYAVLLVLVAGAISVAVLQPPGSFDTDGHIWKAALSYLSYLFGAPFSFLTAMMGLIGVLFGFHSLSDPVFYGPPRTSDALDGSATSTEIEIIDDNISRLNRVGLYLSFSMGSSAIAIYSLGLRALNFSRVFIIVAPFGFVILIILEANMPSLRRYCSERKIKRMNTGPRRST